MGDEIARAVLETYGKLPKKGKPLVKSNGQQEWTVLAGFVVELNGELECVCVTTGLKATPNDKLKLANGKVLHDCHAEILAIRALNRYLLERIEAGDLKYLDHLTDNKYQVKDGVKFHLYISEAPCGDASMGLTSSGFDEANDTWTREIDAIGHENGQHAVIRGRDHFFHVGVVRTKPGRRDSPVTFSKSCSDKLAIKQFSSLLLGATEVLISATNFFISTLTIPESKYLEKDTTRAFRTRFSCDNSLLKSNQSYFDVTATSLEFAHARKPEHSPCPSSIIYINSKLSSGNKIHEVVLNGVKMGAKPFTGKGQSILSRHSLWFTAIALHAGHSAKRQKIDTSSYIEWKKRHSAKRQEIKQQLYKVLGNWVPTAPDDFPL
ncbi:tRNA-specific adenosine deaminase 1 [Trichomonascus vanleenenianus]|uniref:tRNA-specific adenosine deaminase n=1 Tax=Trichomonascus vanleenenianus TaxID=2268995 RepID=UPI003EC9D4DC